MLESNSYSFEYSISFIIDISSLKLEFNPDKIEIIHIIQNEEINLTYFYFLFLI